jgi:P-type Ca2+ transporter type 2C
MRDLAFIGFVGMTDPPAPGVRDTIARFDAAGIRTLMLTGDQRATAEAVARSLGLLDSGGTALDGVDVDELPDDELQERIGRVRAISRVSPEAKLRVVRALQARGDIVTMLGDGVNDAPALRQADVGVAMGGRGTDVAKEAADIVLEDDRFETIGVAVEEGRAIFDNVRRFVFYLLACNLAEIATLAAGGLVGAAAPLIPLQILWLNLATDTTPALALALEPAVPGAMTRPPRKPGTSLLPARLFRFAVALSILITAATLLAYMAGARGWAVHGAPGAGDSLARGRTYAFMTIAFAQLWLVGAARWPGPATGLPNGDGGAPAPAAARGLRRFTRNPWAWAAVIFTTLLQVVIVYLPPIAAVLQLVPLGVTDWGLIAALGAAPAIIASVVLHLQRWRTRSRMRRQAAA